MVFDGLKFYIGSSTDVRKRMNKWKSILTKGYKKNYLVSDAFVDCAVVLFEILEIVPKSRDNRISEDIYIKQNWGNSLFLNRSNNANGTGAKKTSEQLINWTNTIVNKQKVGKFNINGKLVKIYDSMKWCTRELGVTKYCINNEIPIKGFVFKRVNEFGEVIVPQR